MLKKEVEELPLSTKSTEQRATSQQPAWSWAMLCCACAFVLCILVSVAPLHRLAGTPLLLNLPISRPLEVWGVWLPSDLHLAKNHHASQISTHNIESLLLIALAFVIYGLSALVIQRQPKAPANTRVLRLTWLIAVIGGLIFVFTPAMLSRDIFVYAGYGRIIVAHGANPYFIPLAKFPHDSLTHLDDWKNATSAYGPLWLGICSLWALVLGGDPVRYIFAFRFLGLAAHLLNILLVTTLLRMTGRSQRTILLGTLLYAWNPLVLLESCLGGHNDTLIVTFTLLGILLCIRAERKGFTLASSYLPPIVAFTLAALIKFTVAPLIIFFLVALVRRAAFPTSSDPLSNPRAVAPYWRSALLKGLFASLISGLIALAMYAPFWIGHSLSDIMYSFSSPPSARYAGNSILRAIYEWIKVNKLPAHKTWTQTLIYFFSFHRVWNDITILTLAIALIIGAVYLWRTPTTQSIVLATLATLGALLIVTPWFFAWYVIWLIGLAVVLLPPPDKRIGQALVAFALTFSATAFFTYLFIGYPPVGGWSDFRCLTTIGPPLLVFFIILIAHQHFPRRLSIQSDQ